MLGTCSEVVNVSMLPQECFKVLKSLNFRLVGVDLFLCMGLVAFGTVRHIYTVLNQAHVLSQNVEVKLFHWHFP